MDSQENRKNKNRNTEQIEDISPNVSIIEFKWSECIN